MNLRQLAARASDRLPPKNASEVPDGVPNPERCLTLLVEGAARNMPEIDAELHRGFRANVSRLSLQIPDRLPEEDKLALIRSILHEFENYRSGAEAALRDRTACWRAMATVLFREVQDALGADGKCAAAVALSQEIGRLATAEEIKAWRGHMLGFLHPVDPFGGAGRAALKGPDRSTANDNAAGLRGGGSAVAHLRKIMEHNGSGFIVLFRLSCLDVINQRFGPEAVQDCLMAVSAYLTASLHSEDAIYHWSDAALLAILQGRPSEQILTAELQRIASHNRESSVNVAGRTIMLRTPLAFDITPIGRLHEAEDLYKVSARRANAW